MLTRSQFQKACTPQKLPETQIKKGNVILLQGVQKIVMARLQSDAENPVTYSICDDDFRNPRFGITLDGVEVVPSESLSEIVRKRAMNFV